MIGIIAALTMLFIVAIWQSVRISNLKDRISCVNSAHLTDALRLNQSVDLLKKRMNVVEAEYNRFASYIERVVSKIYGSNEKLITRVDLIQSGIPATTDEKFKEIHTICESLENSIKKLNSETAETKEKLFNTSEGIGSLIHSFHKSDTRLDVLEGNVGQLINEWQDYHDLLETYDNYFARWKENTDDSDILALAHEKGLKVNKVNSSWVLISDDGDKEIPLGKSFAEVKETLTKTKNHKEIL